MINQYKPSKPQKVKPAKPAKAAKPAKPAKAAPIGVGAATAVKIEKPKKVKEPKAPKVPKPEKVKAISFGKVQKAEPLGAVPGIKKPVNTKVVAAVLLAVIAIVAVIAVVVLMPKNDSATATDVKHITIAAKPEKTEYYTNQVASYTGLKVLVTQKNGDTYTVEAKHCQITGFDSSAPVENQKITVTYQGESANFNITIKERPAAAKLLKSIKLETLPKTQYKLGESLDTQGGVIICEYQDGTTAQVELTNKHVSGFGKITTAGTHTLTVKYTEGGIEATTTYTITVTK